MSDYYQDLGVERSATAEEIKRAYRRLARQLHPDVNSGAEAEEQFKTVSRAYEVLSDPDKRRNYDLGVDPFAAGGGAGFSGQGFSFSDVMDAFFGGAATQRGPRSRAHRGQDALVRIQIDLHDAVFGSEEEPSPSRPPSDARPARVTAASQGPACRPASCATAAARCRRCSGPSSGR